MTMEMIIFLGEAGLHPVSLFRKQLLQISGRIHQHALVGSIKFSRVLAPNPFSVWNSVEPPVRTTYFQRRHCAKLYECRMTKVPSHSRAEAESSGTRTVHVQTIPVCLKEEAFGCRKVLLQQNGKQAIYQFSDNLPLDIFTSRLFAVCLIFYIYEEFSPLFSFEIITGVVLIEY